MPALALFRPMTSLVFALTLVTHLSVLGFDITRKDNVRLLNKNRRSSLLTHVLNRWLRECADAILVQLILN